MNSSTFFRSIYQIQHY